MGWLGLLKAAQRFDPSVGQFGNYARQKIDGAIRDALRKEWGRVDSQGHRRMKRHPQFIDFDLIDRMWATHDDERDHTEQIEFAETMLGALSPRYRYVFHLYFWDGLSQKEIAKILNVCEGRVAQIMRKGFGQMLSKGTGHLVPRSRKPVDEPLLAL